MNKAEFQKKLVRLWMTTDGELTAPMVAKHTGAGAAELKGFLKELIAEGAITTSRNAENQLTFQVPKKPRAAQVKKLRALKAAKEAAAAKAGGGAAKAAAKPAAKKQDGAAKKAAAAERKRRAQEAAESLKDEPLTAAEMEKLMSLTASVSADMEVKREQDEKRKAAEAEHRAAQAAKQAELDELDEVTKAQPDPDPEPPDTSKKPKKKKSKKKKKSSLDKLDVALAVYEAMDDKPAVVDDDIEERKEQKPGFFARLRNKFRARDAIEIAGQAKKEIEEPKEPGKKSMLWSGGLSLLLGPLGWNYAGSFREAIPGSVVWLAFGALVGKLPLFSFVLLPAFLGGMALSGVVGLVYAWQFNKHGKRVRLFGDSDKKQLTE